MEIPAPPPAPSNREDPKAARARLLNDLALWMSDAILAARQVIEGHFGAAHKPPAPHELEAIVRSGTALFQTAVLLQAQQQAIDQASKQITGFEPPPELRKAMNEMMKRAPKIIDEILRESHEGEEWKKPADDEGEDEPPAGPPRKRRHPEDEPTPDED